ncbi:hypothetical protein D3C72_1661080 [compost metagenome]
MAGFSEDCRKSRPRRPAGALACPPVRPADARGAARPPCAGPDDAELCRQCAGAGQRGHTHRPQGHAGAAGHQPLGHLGKQRADPVSGAERLVAHLAAGHDLHVPAPAGRGRPHPGVPAHPAGHLGFDAGGLAQRCRGAASAAVASGGAGVSAAGGAAAGGVHGLSCHPDRHRPVPGVVAAGQHHPLLASGAVRRGGGAAQGAGVRGFCGRRQGRL